MSPIRRALPFDRRRGLAIVALAALAGLVGLAVLESQRRSSLYWYEVGADQEWAFDAGDRFDVDLRDAGFVLPETVAPGQTVVLSLQVSASVSGRWYEPRVRVTLPGGGSSVHYFERGAKGMRRLVLGPVLRGEPGGAVSMTGEYLRWETGSASLRAFAPPPALSGPVLVLAPHPDDAEIAAFGLYSNTDSWVVTVSAGQNVDGRMAHLVEDPVERSRLKGELRAWDSVSIPRWGGVPPDRAVNLGYFNLGLAAMYADPERVVADPVSGDEDVGIYRDVAASGLFADRAPESSWSSLVEDLVVVLDRVQPAVIVTPHPALDVSSDHRLTTIALLQALERVGPAGRTLLTYTNHATGAEYYPFGPADGAAGLPPWTGTTLHADGVFVHPLDSAQRVRKLYALEAQHDLRPAPRFVPASPLRRILGELGRTAGGLLRDPTDTFSYMRRGPRPNEVFLVYRESSARQLGEAVQDWLLGLRADPSNRGAY